MFVILASRADEAARQLAARWQSYDALVLTAKDISSSGWRFHLPFSADSRAVANGRQLAFNEITGVVTRLSCISAQELGHIVPEDRSYVAAEMTAFLTAWLSRLSCPVVNRPTPGCLAGPNWRREQWVHLAAGLDIPVAPCHRRAALGKSVKHPESQGAEVIVVGDRCFGDVDSLLLGQARQVARAAGMELLSVHFTGPGPGSKFMRVDVWPDVSVPHIADAVLACLQGRARC